MPDILSQGRDRRPGRWPRRLAVAAALLLVAAVIFQHLSGARPAAARPAAARPAAARPASVTIGGPGEPGLTAQPDGITGQSLPWPAGARLPVAGERPAWFWPATGRARPIGGLPPQRPGYQFIRAVGGWAVQAAPGSQPRCGGCAGPPRTVYFLAYRAQSVTWAGLANAVAPGAAAGELWLTNYRPGADPRTTAGTAREVSAAGVPLGPAVRLPAGYTIEQATDRGLLLAPAALPPGAGPYRLWDPGAAQPGRAVSGVVAAGPGRLAWVTPCTARCRVRVLDLATGRLVSAGLPEGSSVANAAFSPDGRLLALQVSFLDNDDDGALAMRLELLATASGRLAVVPDTWVSSDALVGFGWPEAGDTLAAELSFMTKVQLASWVAGGRRPAVAVLTGRPGPASLVLGQDTP